MACCNPLLMKLVEVLDERCKNWPCDVKLTPLIPDCPGCNPCGGATTPDNWTMTLIPTNNVCSDCTDAWGTDPITLFRFGGPCKWIAVGIATLCPEGTGYHGPNLTMEAGTPWTLTLRDDATVLKTWECTNAVCDGTNVFTVTSSPDTRCNWPNTVPVSPA